MSCVFNGGAVISQFFESGAEGGCDMVGRTGRGCKRPCDFSFSSQRPQRAGAGLGLFVGGARPLRRPAEHGHHVHTAGVDPVCATPVDIGDRPAACGVDLASLQRANEFEATDVAARDLHRLTQILAQRARMNVRARPGAERTKPCPRTANGTVTLDAAPCVSGDAPEPYEIRDGGSAPDSRSAAL